MVGDFPLGKAPAKVVRRSAAAHDQMPHPEKAGLEKFFLHDRGPAKFPDYALFQFRSIAFEVPRLNGPRGQGSRFERMGNSFPGNGVAESGGIAEQEPVFPGNGPGVEGARPQARGCLLYTSPSPRDRG